MLINNDYYYCLFAYYCLVLFLNGVSVWEICLNN